MKSGGFTLIEVIIAGTLLTAALGMIWQAWLTVNDTAETLDVKMTVTEGAVYAVDAITTELRQASIASISGLPAAAITFRSAEDVDGNGYALDAGGAAELGEPRTIMRDTEDSNGDGLRGSQLVLTGSGKARVLANHLAPNEDRNANGTLDAGEDANANGRLDMGVWFVRDGDAVRVQVQSVAPTRRGSSESIAVQSVRPRNP